MKKRLIGTLTAVLLGCFNTSARSYFGNPHTFTQPDGDSVSVRLYGNDYILHAESNDGYTLIQDPDDGYICYALVSADSSEYASSGIRYRGEDAPKAVSMIVEPHVRISSDAIARKIVETKAVLGVVEKSSKPQLRSATVMPDTVYGVTVLIDFPDCKFPWTMSELDKFLNADKGSINGNSMSIKEYFRWISNGKLTYINLLPKKPYTAPNSKSYYSPENASTYTFNLLKPVVNDALNSYSKSTDGFDLTDLTVNGKQYYAVNILYAGDAPTKYGTGLWPHQSFTTFTINNDSRVGKSVYQPYQIGYCSDDLVMGCFVHESFHLLLDAPDFYPYDGHTGNTAEVFNVADEFHQVTNKNPPIPNPWILDNAGWLENKIVLNDLKKGTKVNLEYGPGNVAVYYGNVDGNPMKERYYLEVRDFHYDEYYRTIKNKGVYIWHVYEPGDNRYSNKTDKLDCRPASSTNPFWSSSSPSKVFSDDSDPSAKWNNGDNSGLYLCNFSKPDTKMSFCYGECSDKGEEVSIGGNDKDQEPEVKEPETGDDDKDQEPEVKEPETGGDDKDQEPEVKEPETGGDDKDQEPEVKEPETGGNDKDQEPEVNEPETGGNDKDQEPEVKEPETGGNDKDQEPEVKEPETGGDETPVYEKLALLNKDSLPSGMVGKEYYAKLNAVGGDGNYSIVWKDGLPDGLSLNSDLEIVGKPKSAIKKMLKLHLYDGTGTKTEVWLKLTIDENSSVDDALAERPMVSLMYLNEGFAIASMQNGVNCTVYTINGTKMENFAIENGEIHIFGANYPTGIYLVDANGIRIKIVKY